MKFEPRIKLNHNIYSQLVFNPCITLLFTFFPLALQTKIPGYVRGVITLASQRTRDQRSIYKSFLKLFYVCLGWGNSSIVVHIVVDSLRCVEDMEFCWTNDLVYYGYYCYNKLFTSAVD